MYEQYLLNVNGYDLPDGILRKETYVCITEKYLKCEYRDGDYNIVKVYSDKEDVSIDVETKCINETDMALIMQAFDDDTVKVRYLDTKIGQYKERLFTYEPFEIKVLRAYGTRILYDSFKIQLRSV